MGLRSFNNTRASFADYLSKTGTDASKSIGGAFSATGGSEVLTPGNGYKYHYFTSSSTPGFEVISGSSTIDVLIVAGGGGGASYTGSAYANGLVGSATTFNHPSTPYVVSGGGGGDAYNDSALTRLKDGGSGGGGGNARVGGYGYNPLTPAPVLAAVPSGQGGPLPSPYPITQGFGGGTSSGVDGGGGGGGAAGGGTNATAPNTHGPGGPGKSAFSGDVGIPASYGESGPNPGRYFAGGGGGGGRVGSAGVGGVGGGGDGTVNGVGQNGTANTGGGGGSGDNGSGAGHGGGGAGGYRELSGIPVSVGPYPVLIGAGGAGNPYAGSGGSGIVIVRYLL